MQFTPKLARGGRTAIEAALPRLLRPGETPVLGANGTYFRRMQLLLLVTDRRVLGLDAGGGIRVTVPAAEVTRAELNARNLVVTLTTPEARTAVGALAHASEWDDLLAALESACPRLPRREPEPEVVAPAPGPADAAPPRAPVPASSIAAELTQLATLHAAGALSDAEFEAAKRAALGHVSAAAAPLAPPAPPAPAPATAPRRGRVVKEMQRTCRGDGTVWFVPLDVARYRPPSRMLTGGLKMQEFAATGLLTGDGATASTQLGRIEAQTARAQAARQCPTCGSQAFTEAVVKH